MCQRKKKYLVIVSGPTASGKSGVAMKLARRYTCSIISADSRQIYKGMDIGTAKPTGEELREIKHYFIDILPPEKPYSAGEFEKKADEVIQKELEENGVAIVCGGTAFYIDSLLFGLDSFPKIPFEVKERLNAELKEKGIEKLAEEVRRADSETAAEIDLDNPRRVIRALSIIRHTQKPMSFFKQKKNKELNYHPIFILLQPDRDKLYQKINARVDAMVEKGLENEARQLYERHPQGSIETVGYTEWFDYFKGTISREECIRLIKRNTRRYAKRQLTWFRKQDYWQRFSGDRPREIIQYTDQQINWNADKTHPPNESSKDSGK